MTGAKIMPAVFDNLGIRFQYPENWELGDVDMQPGQQSVTVYTPAGGFWAVTLHPSGTDPVDTCKAVVSAIQEEYEEVEVEEIRETTAGYPAIGYDMNFFYLDLTNTARVRAVTTRWATYTVVCQAEDREFAQLEAVFQAITVSLLNDL